MKFSFICILASILQFDVGELENTTYSYCIMVDFLLDGTLSVLIALDTFQGNLFDSYCFRLHSPIIHNKYFFVFLIHSLLLVLL